MMMLFTVSAFVLALVPSSLAYSEVGCFTDQPVRILTDVLTSSSSMTVDVCNKMCSDAGYYFAAVEYGNQCLCGNNLKRYQKLADSSCATPCAGNANQICGGTWKASVYTTDVAFVPLGCYEDKSDRILEGAVTISETDMTPEYCINECKKQGKRFALTEYAKQCYCGNHLEAYPKKPDTECNYPCTGDQTKMCGGFWRGNLYLLN